MNEMYSEVREHLRRQHAMNTQEIHGKNADNFYRYGYYGCNNAGADGNEDAPWTFSLKGKIFLFLLCVMLFSCYLYGGQDVKKGAVMAWQDMNIQITRLEEEKPEVKQVMGYIRTAYHEIKEFAETYMNMGE
ncbi:MAG: hypothetical protein NC300_11170 [Bacteroidales bacterium]|nr:hypothetical protein [Clostridium sp.]MCM1204691.1 hypothetical protein [Bacteroidales bacterium]